MAQTLERSVSKGPWPWHWLTVAVGGLVVGGMVGQNPSWGEEAVDVYKKSEPIVATMEIEKTRGGIVVRPRCRAPAGGVLRFQLQAEKMGTAGRGSSSQSGIMVLDRGEERVLGRMAFNVRPGDTFVFDLKIFDHELLRVHKTVHYP